MHWNVKDHTRSHTNTGKYLPQLWQRSKRCSSHYSKMYHAKSQWVKKSNTQLSFLHNVKKAVGLKFKSMSIPCGFQVFDVVLILYISNSHVRNYFKVTLLFQINFLLLKDLSKQLIILLI